MHWASLTLIVTLNQATRLKPFDLIPTESAHSNTTILNSRK